MSNNFRYRTFRQLLEIWDGKVWVVDDVLASHEQQKSSTTSLHRNCIELEIQTDQN